MSGIRGIYHHGKLNVNPKEFCWMRYYMFEYGPD